MNLCQKKNYSKLIWVLIALGLLALIFVIFLILTSQPKEEKGEELNLVPPPATNQIVPVFSEPTFFSFFDSFDNDLKIDWDKTELHYDQVSAAIMFPPKYQWKEVRLWPETEKQLKDLRINNFQNPDISYDKRCLDDNCLEQVGLTLMFQGQGLKLPQELEKNLASLTIGTVGKKWLVGASLKNGETYEGLVWWFDGQKFTSVLNNKISSKYYGEWGFGGEEDDFLMVYGAYKGEAWRVRSGQTTDISYLFSYRVMDKGFRPEIIKSGNAWFVFSLSTEKPRLLKIWENEAGELSGEVSFYKLVNSHQSAVLIKAKNGFYALLSGGVEAKSMQFIDEGFDLKTNPEVFFKPIVFEQPVNITKIANVELGSLAPRAEGGGGDVSFLNGNKWESTPQGYYINREVSLKPNNNLFLRVTIPKSKNKFYSPFLSQLVFDFYYSR